MKSKKLKFGLVFLLVILTHFSFSQKWSYKGHDKTEKYGHEYWFSFQNEEDTNSYLLKRTSLKDSNKNFIISFSDNYNDSLFFFGPVQILNLEDNSFKLLYLDSLGKTSVRIDSGKYKISVSFFSHDNFELTFVVSSKEHLHLDVKLGKTAELTVYQINSKRKLSKKKVETIINCIKQGERDNPSFGCERKRKYYITIHI